MTTPSAYFNETLPANLTKDPEKASSVGAIYQFNITGDDGGTWAVDLTKDSEWVTDGDHDGAQCTITMSSEDFVDLITGKLPATQAFMMGKLKIEGNMGLAMKLQSVLS